MLNTIKSYKSNEIEKSEYIKKMYSFHNLLFEYKELLKTNIISEIIINKDELITKFKDPEINIIINEHDHRIAPIESLNFNDYEGQETKSRIPHSQSRTKIAKKETKTRTARVQQTLR